MNTTVLESLKTQAAAITQLDGQLDYLAEQLKDTRALRRTYVKILNKTIARYPEEATAAEVKMIVKEEKGEGTSEPTGDAAAT